MGGGLRVGYISMVRPESRSVIAGCRLRLRSGLLLRCARHRNRNRNRNRSCNHNRRNGRASQGGCRCFCMQGWDVMVQDWTLLILGRL